MEIKAEDSYLTRNGTHASVWEWSKNVLGQECWVGAVQGGGFNCWDQEGRDLSGTTEWDLVAPVEKTEAPIGQQLKDQLLGQGVSENEAEKMKRLFEELEEKQ